MSQYRKGFLKVVFIGDSGVGKTSILEVYKNGKFHKSSKPTIGAEFLKKKVTFEDGSEVTLQLWDTAGQERF
jgi:Ras-related protein Rab-7A